MCIIRLNGNIQAVFWMLHFAPVLCSPTVMWIAEMEVQASDGRSRALRQRVWAAQTVISCTAGLSLIDQAVAMTEATSCRGELCCDIGLPDINQATSTPQEWVQAGGMRGAGGRSSSRATWPLGLVTRGQSNLMRVHWGKKRRERVMGTGQ